MNYRRDIDGLRAIAVSSVVIFHIAQSFLRGGFVGVDIFFVISGYLISGNIFQQLADGNFRLADFYERRIRRIVPAYVVVTAFTTIVVLSQSFPSETSHYGRSLIAAVTSVTNIHFWATQDYFAPEAEELPLLHTWSLSVEEQFYLVFPLFVMAIWRVMRRASIVVLISTLFFVSLATSAVTVHYFPSATFYLLPTRSWELLLGSLLALNVVPALTTRVQRNLCAGIGLALIAVPMLLYTPFTTFPGLTALPPCLGAACIIHAGRDGENIVSRLLSLGPVVFVGLISYSLYLWHWPIMVFQRTNFLLIATDNEYVARGAVLAVSLICATASWYFVERPTRNRRVFGARQLVTGMVTAGIAFVAVGVTLVQTGGLPGRFSVEAQQMARYTDYDHDTPYKAGKCFLNFQQPFEQFDTADCLPNDLEKPNYILLGDSHAASLASGLRASLPDANMLQITGVGCAPLLIWHRYQSAACPKLIGLAMDDIPSQRQVKAVLLKARWRLAWLPNLENTIRELKKRNLPVIIVGPYPEYQSPLPRLLAKSIQDHDPNVAKRLLWREIFDVDAKYAQFARKEGVEYISLVEKLCPSGLCMEYAAPNVPFLFDGSHATEAGSLISGRIVATELAKNESDSSLTKVSQIGKK